MSQRYAGRMGVLRNEVSEQRVVLRSPHRIGRSLANHLVLASAGVSGDHASITWSDRWVVRDLGSRNGTFVNDVRLESGARHPLAKGDRVRFGSDPDVWMVTSEGPPAASARCDTNLVEGAPDFLALPSEADPELVVRFDEGQWWSDERAVRDGDSVEADGRTWRLSLPEQLAPTAALGDPGPRLDTAELRFAVTDDEEYVEVTVQLPDGPRVLVPRAHHYLLLVLARARQEDRDEGASATAEGWRYTEDVQRMLRASKNQIYVSVHRIRRELKALGLVDAEAIVERRRTTGQLRIGVGRSHVESL
ncbi:MAG: FHA domain-containing protein [Myxococcota bacterium]